LAVARQFAAERGQRAVAENDRGQKGAPEGGQGVIVALAGAMRFRAARSSGSGRTSSRRVRREISRVASTSCQENREGCGKMLMMESPLRCVHRYLIRLMIHETLELSTSLLNYLYFGVKNIIKGSASGLGVKTLNWLGKEKLDERLTQQA